MRERLYPILMDVFGGVIVASQSVFEDRVKMPDHAELGEDDRT